MRIAIIITIGIFVGVMGTVLSHPAWFIAQSALSIYLLAFVLPQFFRRRPASPAPRPSWIAR